MKKNTLFAISVSALLSCTACNNSGPINYGYGKERSRFSDKIDQVWVERGVDEYQINTGNTPEVLEAAKDEMMKIYGKNKLMVSSYDPSLAFTTPYGTYVGKKDNNNIVSWKGVPYAKAPIKDLRWKTPQKLDESNDVYQAYYFGSSSIQCVSFDEPSSLYPQGEDCLNINIWNNQTDTSTNKPIMVWIHGGAYIQGGTSDTVYEGTNIVKNNPEVIYASIDYRTDFLGFVNFSDVPGGDKYKESANLGLLDQVAALAWLKENASSFGGDPNRITIFGESAGGGSTSALTIMPSAKGLFKRAIVQSGSSSNFLRTAEKSKAQTQKILDICGAKNMNELLELTAKDIEKIATILGVEGTATYTYPQLDGITLPLDIKKSLEGDARDGIDILGGTTKDEYEYWTHIMTQEENKKTMVGALANFTTRMTSDELSRYNQFRDKLTGSPYRIDIQTINYLSFHAPSRFEARTHAKNGGKVYQYLFTEEVNDGYINSETGEYQGYGSFHGAELPFLFGNITDNMPLSCTIEEANELSITMQKMWVNFALTGNPSTSSIPWNPYTLQDDKVMIINAKGCAQENDPLRENIDLMGDVYWAKLRS